MSLAQWRIQSRAVPSPVFACRDLRSRFRPEDRPALNFSIIGVLLVFVCLPIAADPASNSQATLPPGPSGPFEQMTIRRSTGGAPPAATQPAGSSTVNPGRWDLSKIPLSLAGVILLILVMRWLGKRLIPGAGRAKGSSAVQVLVRSTIGPRQQLMLVQVGRRLVLVGSGGAEMNPLCQIEDPEEVAELLGQIQGEKRAGLKNFGAIFGRAEKAYEEPEPEPPPSIEPGEPPPTSLETREELSGLMERVRRIANQFQSS
jgi:flagellar protein FliO/FliZ